MLTPSERYEIELAVYQAHLAQYQQAISENPAMEKWLAKPEEPTMLLMNSHWNMRGVVTGARRRWKHHTRS
jgi:hypothetical protein